VPDTDEGVSPHDTPCSSKRLVLMRPTECDRRFERGGGGVHDVDPEVVDATDTEPASSSTTTLCFDDVFRPRSKSSAPSSKSYSMALFAPLELLRSWVSTSSRSFVKVAGGDEAGLRRPPGTGRGMADDAPASASCDGLPDRPRLTLRWTRRRLSDACVPDDATDMQSLRHRLRLRLFPGRSPDLDCEDREFGTGDPPFSKCAASGVIEEPPAHNGGDDVKRGGLDAEISVFSWLVRLGIVEQLVAGIDVAFDTIFVSLSSEPLDFRL
jgi:hypothetical protein